MKKMKFLMLGLLISTLTFSIVDNCNAQNNILEETKNQFLISSQVKLTPSQIISNFKEGPDFRSGERWLKEDVSAKSTPFESSYKLNVFDYFNLTETYDSELKKEVFKQTTEYKLLLDSLKNIKADYLSSLYYLTSFDKFKEDVFIKTKFDNSGRERTEYQVNYDIQKKGFLMDIGEVLPYHCVRNFLPRVIEDIEFKQLPIHKKYNISNSKNSYTQYLFIPMDASTALEIENNRIDIGILLVFEIKGIYKAQFNDNDFIKDSYGYVNKKICKVEVVKGGNLRMLIYNKKSEVIYYDKLYPVISTKN